MADKQHPIYPHDIRYDRLAVTDTKVRTGQASQQLPVGQFYRQRNNRFGW